MPWTWLWNLCYVCLLVAVSPVLLYHAVVRGKYREGWAEKLRGELPRCDGEIPTMWLHAVSVGEVLQLEPLLCQLKAERPDWRFVITTTTTTGLQVARQKYPDDVVCYAPLDFSWAVRKAMRRINPQVIVLIELEIWPNLLAVATSSDVPVLLVNGRISAKSYRRYRRAKPLLKSTFARLTRAAVQTDEYAHRLCDLGVPAERIHVTGSIKFDRVDTTRCAALTQELRRCFDIAENETVLIAGSTQYPEEEIALRVYRRLLPRFPALRLILVPRHKERFDEVAALVEREGFSLIRRSRPKHSNACDGMPRVGLLDTLGELSACWGLADVAFVGGSLTRRGGQNMIEPAGYGAAVLFGPNTHNFKDVVEMLLSRDAACVVRSETEFGETVGRLLNDREAAGAMGRRAQDFVLGQQGATARTVSVMLPDCGNSAKNGNTPCNSSQDRLSWGDAA